MKKIAIIVCSQSGLSIAQIIKKEFSNVTIYSKTPAENTHTINSLQECVNNTFPAANAIIFIGALGICVRLIAPLINNKYNDPAILNIDTNGKFVIPVISGHIGGANELALKISHTIGGKAVITTQSDNSDLWALDTIGQKYNWLTTYNTPNLNTPIISFVNKKPTALLLDIKDDGADYLERTKPNHVTIYYNYKNIDLKKYSLFIAVTPFIYSVNTIETIYFHPQILHLGIGCRKNCSINGISEYIASLIKKQGIALQSIKDISSIELKKDEPLLKSIQKHLNNIPIVIYKADELRDIEVTNPSEKVESTTTLKGVAESTAIKSANYGLLILEKQKGKLSDGNDFTFAIAIEKDKIRKGHIEIVGAGPGDPDLISIKGRHFLEQADLILYAGSLVPIELTYCAKNGAVVRSSASLSLNEQFELMKKFYDKGKLIVRLHTGDPCIYGAIQEQMAFFDKYHISYHITPGISSFQAAAAALKSQFTIPEKVQTIILTRGEGKTPMPEKEKLHLLARSQSTMCIFLSAAIVDDIQTDLLKHYSHTTPIAVCYKLTWKDERIYRGQLQDLSKIVKDNKLTLTTMIVIGEAIDNRKGLSKLYSHEFKHLFRQ